MAGTVEHAASSDIIQERCKKVIAIFSPSFLKSRENEFLTNFAQYIGIQTGQYIIIPVILKDCKIPSQFQLLAKLKYEPQKKIVNFWERLLCKTLGVSEPLRKDLKEYKDYSTNAKEIVYQPNQQQSIEYNGTIQPQSSRIAPQNPSFTDTVLAATGGKDYRSTMGNSSSTLTDFAGDWYRYNQMLHNNNSYKFTFS